jgi:hypothetical protein
MTTQAANPNTWEAIGWPRFVTAPAAGEGNIHFGAASIDFQRNTARAEAQRTGTPQLVYIAIERWMPNGTIDPIPAANAGNQGQLPRKGTDE